MTPVEHARIVMRRGRSALRPDNRRLLAEMIRYGMVSGLAFGVDYGSLALFKEVGGLHYLWAATFAFMLGIATNYLCSRLYVFNSTPHTRRTELTLFLAVGMTGLLLNNLIMWTFTSGVGLHYLISKLISTGMVFFWNFLLRRFLIYTGRPNPLPTPTKVYSGPQD